MAIVGILDPGDGSHLQTGLEDAIPKWLRTKVFANFTNKNLNSS
jgi:hypothetical protein